MRKNAKVLSLILAGAMAMSLAGCSGSGSKDSAKETAAKSEAKEAGADILSIITPYFAAISQNELYAHYKEVAEAVDLPIVLYNIPMRTGCNIEPETVERLAEIPNIVGGKRFQRKVGEPFCLYRNFKKYRTFHSFGK